MTGRRITREDLERSLAELRREVVEPRAGLFGPETIAWRVSREAALFLGAGRAALLQLAHPYVAYAVADHSVTRTDPLARFRATFRRVFRMTFGDLDEALDAARGVHRVHSRIHGVIREDAGRFPAGHGYDATDVDAQVWVLATLWDTTMIVYERVFGPLGPDERERFFREGRRIGMLFGVESALPRTPAAFQAYMRDMFDGDALTVTTAAAEIGRVIMRPENVPGRLVRSDYGTLTANLLPPRLAEGFGLQRGGDAGARRTDLVFELVRGVFPRLPARLRFLPAYVEARRRLAGLPERDRLGTIMRALYLGRDSA